MNEAVAYLQPGPAMSYVKCHIQSLNIDVQARLSVDWSAPHLPCNEADVGGRCVMLPQLHDWFMARQVHLIMRFCSTSACALHVIWLYIPDVTMHLFDSCISSLAEE